VIRFACHTGHRKDIPLGDVYTDDEHDEQTLGLAECHNAFLFKCLMIPFILLAFLVLVLCIGWIFSGERLNEGFF